MALISLQWFFDQLNPSDSQASRTWTILPAQTPTPSFSQSHPTGVSHCHYSFLLKYYYSFYYCSSHNTHKRHIRKRPFTHNNNNNEKKKNMQNQQQYKLVFSFPQEKRGSDFRNNSVWCFLPGKYRICAGGKYLYKQMVPKAAMEKTSKLTKTNWHFQAIALKKIEFSDSVVSVWTTLSLSNLLNHSDWTLAKF